MRDIFNPLLLLGVLLMLAMRVTNADAEMAQALDVMMLTLCVVCCILNFSLGIARMLVRRRALMPVVWAVVYLIVGCCVWSICCHTPDMGEDRAAYVQLHAQYQEGASPCVRSEEGDSLLALAAALGESRALAEMLRAHGEAIAAEEKVEAAHAAAAAGKVRTLQLLLDAGVGVNACHASVSLLNAAAQNGMTDAMQLLLKMGADANLADDEGTTPLMSAVMTNRPTPVRMLLEHGADVSLLDKSGRDAASYARSEDVRSLVEKSTGQP